MKTFVRLLAFFIATACLLVCVGCAAEDSSGAKYTDVSAKLGLLRTPVSLTADEQSALCDLLMQHDLKPASNLLDENESVKYGRADEITFSYNGQHYLWTLGSNRITCKTTDEHGDTSVSYYYHDKDFLSEIDSIIRKDSAE